MKMLILYHPDSEHGRLVEDFARDYIRQYPGDVQTLSLEQQEGARIAELYEFMSYPVVLVRKDDGQLLKHWEGLPLPLREEVASYLLS